MNVADFTISTSLGVASIVAGIAGATLALPSLEMRRASKVAWSMSGALLWIAGITWSVTEKGEPMWIRYVVAALLGAGSATLTVWGFSLAGDAKMTESNHSPNAATPITINGGDNVVSVGQIGGITARIVNITPPDRPEFRILSKSEEVNQDGSRSIKLEGEVVSPITPGLLELKISGAELLGVRVTSAPVNGVSTTNLRNVRSGPSEYSVEIPAPRGRYQIEVKTMSLSPIAVSASF